MNVEHQAEIDDVQCLQPEVFEIIGDGACQFVRRERRQPRGIFTPSCADLGADLQVLRIWEQRLADQPVGDVRAGKVAGVEVVHPRVDGSAQHGPRLIGVARQGLLVPSASKTKLDFRNESLSMIIAGN